MDFHYSLALAFTLTRPFRRTERKVSKKGFRLVTIEIVGNSYQNYGRSEI
jgi:hypothetical protein